MKKLLLSLLFFVCVYVNQAQTTSFVEEFNYTAGTLLTAMGYTVSSGGGTNALTATSPGLTYPGYASVAGNALTLTTTGEDDYKAFTPLTSGSVYLSFLINVQSAQSGDYFIALSASTLQTGYTCRTLIKTNGTGFSLGVTKSNENSSANYGSTVLSFNTTYLVVVKYKFNTGSTNDDAISLYVFSGAIPANEPTTTEFGPYVCADVAKLDLADLGFVTFRQGSSSNAPALILDGVRIASNWGVAVTGTATDVAENISGLPTRFDLMQNYPNPFNPSTLIKYQVPQNTHVNISVYDILGNKISTLVNQEKAAGSYEVTFSADDMPSGVYFYTIQTGSFTQTKKMILMK